jgi:hypothetical protein
MTNLIITPVGCDITFHDAYDKENHWRFTDKANRVYETLAVVYNDYVPPENTYDHIIHLKAHKWQIVRALAMGRVDGFDLDLTKYDYIGCVDDDLVTDIQSFNVGLLFAKINDFRIWQLSMLEGSGIIYDCLKQNKDWLYSTTNFVEMGSTFFRQDKFQEVVKFFDELDFQVGWGIDKVWCDVLNTTANVVHAASIYHPPNTIKPSYYSQAMAMQEMNDMISNVYPKVMAQVYGRVDWKFRDVQETLSYLEKM